MSNLSELKCININSSQSTSNVNPPVSNTIPVCSISRHPTKSPRKNHISVLLNIKPEQIPEFKKLRLCLLNLRSIGDDIKAGKIKDFVDDPEHELDGAFFTET